MSEPTFSIWKSPRENSATAEHDESFRIASAFFTIVTILLSYASLHAIFQGTALVSYSRLIPFLVLMAAHITLHWLSLRFSLSPTWRLVYIGLQIILSMSVVLISQSDTLALAIFASLVAEQIGLNGFERIPIMSIVVFVAMNFLSYFIIGGMELIDAMSPPSISTFVLLIVFMIMFRQQIETRERSQELLHELEAASHQLTENAGQIEALTLTTERQRLARELHDTLAQDMSGLVLQLEAIKHHLGSGNIERSETIIDQAMIKARRTLADTRRAIDDLHLELEAPSLRDVLQKKVERFSTSVGIPFHLDITVPELASIPYMIREHAQRIIDEGVNNISRHANASEVWLKVEQAKDELRIQLRDDGIGFNMDGEIPAGHYGLQGMHERAELVGGSLEISSAPGAGTTLNVVLPLKDTA